MFQSIDVTNFNVKDCIVAGDECILVTPKDMGVTWDDKNKHLRSSIWRKSDKKLVSAGFKKFTNLGEQPEFEPIDNYTDLEFIRKLDGSLLIVSRHNGELIVRTRGTIDASQLENGHEIELLKTKYPDAFNNFWLDSEKFSLLFEWTTPTNRIVLQESAEPTLWLIGIVGHDAYSFMGKQDPYYYLPQNALDQQARVFGVLRPERYTLNLQNVAEYLKDETSIEGVVIYANNGQILKKVKTPRYLYLHRVFTGVKTVDHLFDLFVEYGQPVREDFEKKLADNFDWELVTALKPLMDQLYQHTRHIADKIFWIIMYLQNPDFIALDRKGKARKILELFPDYSWIGFSLLDGKELDPHKLWKAFTNSCS
jgi:hypothetical protein